MKQVSQLERKVPTFFINLLDKAVIASADPPGARPIPKSIQFGNNVARVLKISATLYDRYWTKIIGAVA